MKRFLQYITERHDGDGDCMEAAVNLMMRYHSDFFGKPIKSVSGNPFLVHALVYGQGALMGLRFPHAWVEDGDTVHDYSNGGKTVMPKDQYYKLGKISPNEKGAYFRYNYSTMKWYLRRTKHYGPWELNERLEEVTRRMGKMRKPISQKLKGIISEGIVTGARTGGGVRTGTGAPTHGGTVSWNDLKRLESVLDAMFRSANLDIAFTRHFHERINGSRGYGGTVSIPEIQDAFRKTYAKHAQQIRQHPADWKAIINDVSKELNMPFTLDWDGRMKKMVMVTAMKKRDFMSRDPKLKV